MNEQTMLNNLVNALDYIDVTSHNAVMNWLNMFSSFAGRKDLVFPKERITRKLEEAKNNTINVGEQTESFIKLIDKAIDSLSNNNSLNLKEYEEYNKKYIHPEKEEVLSNLRILTNNLSNEELDIESEINKTNEERFEQTSRLLRSTQILKDENLENEIKAKELEVERLKEAKDNKFISLGEKVDSPELTALYQEYDNVVDEMNGATLEYEKAHPNFDDNNPSQEYIDLEEKYEEKLSKIEDAIKILKANNKDTVVKPMDDEKYRIVKKEEVLAQDLENYNNAVKELELLRSKEQAQIQEVLAIPEKEKIEQERLASKAEILRHIKNSNYTTSQALINSIIRDYSNGVINNGQLYTIIDAIKDLNKPAKSIEGMEEVNNLSLEEINKRLSELSRQRISKLQERDYLDRSLTIEEKALVTLQKDLKTAKNKYKKFNKTENKENNVMLSDIKDIENQIEETIKEINVHKPDLIYQNLFDTAAIEEKLRVLSEQKRYLTAKKSLEDLEKLCRSKIEVKKSFDKTPVVEQAKENEKSEDEITPLPIVKEQEKTPLPIIEKEKEKDKQPLPITDTGKDFKIKDVKDADEKTKDKLVKHFDENKKKWIRRVLTAIVLITVGPLAALGVYHGFNCIANHKGLLEHCGPVMEQTLPDKEQEKEVEKEVEKVIGTTTYDDIVDYNIKDPGDLDHPEDEESKEKDPIKPSTPKPTQMPEAVIEPIVPVTPFVPITPVTPWTPVNPTPGPVDPTPGPVNPTPTPGPVDPTPTPGPVNPTPEPATHNVKIEEIKSNEGDEIKLPTALEVNGIKYTVDPNTGDLYRTDDGTKVPSDSITKDSEGNITNVTVKDEVLIDNSHEEPVTTPEPSVEDIGETQVEEGLVNPEITNGEISPSVENELIGLEDLFNNPDNIETDTSIVDTNSIESINETLDGQSMQP